MRLGFALPQVGPIAGPDSLVSVARRAEELEFDSLWVLDRKDRAEFTGTLEQIADDVAAARKIGAAELLFDVQFSPGVETADDIVARMEQLRKASGQA
jgi:alkanesulfonate monooxygenase SsuD/methylene tetrahydromethanopterin reductase-like flavin-dependent oxidoreductase (luciferase family)